jgi:hypothetical protein
VGANTAFLSTKCRKTIAAFSCGVKFLRDRVISKASFRLRITRSIQNSKISWGKTEAGGIGKVLAPTFLRFFAVTCHQLLAIDTIDFGGCVSERVGKKMLMATMDL